jgi:adenine/guanine phosphoribosyltransferase-like PRPP-binding protein
MSTEHENPVPEPAPPLDPLRKAKIVLSLAALILGLATIAVTVTSGGGIAARGVLLGAILAILAGARLFLIRKAGV